MSVLRPLANAGTYLLTDALVRLFWLYESTLDIRAWGTENLRLLRSEGQRPLLVIWHGKGFVPIAYFNQESLCLYASHSRQPGFGGWEALSRTITLRMIERMGYVVMDASEFKSESRGVLQYIHRLKDANGGAIAADGPGGPIYRAKPGACFLSKKTGVTLLPVGAAISGGYQLDQWDHFEVPRPFARATLVVGEAMYVAADASDEEMELNRLDLESRLNQLTRQAHDKLQWEPSPIRIAV